MIHVKHHRIRRYPAMASLPNHGSVSLTGLGAYCLRAGCNQPQARFRPPPRRTRASRLERDTIVLAVIAAVLFGIGWVIVAFVHGSVPAAIVPGFLYLGLFCLALHLLIPYTPWHRQP